ncbi:MAG: hypothetical protein V5A84_00060, partial [Planctomycetota bacterium]
MGSALQHLQGFLLEGVDDLCQLLGALLQRLGRVYLLVVLVGVRVAHAALQALAAEDDGEAVALAGLDFQLHAV